jgi:hypothetical protein
MTAGGVRRLRAIALLAAIALAAPIAVRFLTGRREGDLSAEPAEGAQCATIVLVLSVGLALWRRTRLRP